MIGNDVVDLGDPEVGVGAQHPRFAERVFTPAERHRIASDPSPQRLRWALWAAKESAYKALRRVRPDIGFSPRQFRVELGIAVDGTARGLVRWRDQSFALCLRADAACVHVWAAQAELAPVALLTHAATVPTTELRGPRPRGSALLRRVLAGRREFAGAAIEIERQGRLPRLRIDGADVPVSFSHHGRFAAFACAPLHARGG